MGLPVSDIASSVSYDWLLTAAIEASDVCFTIADMRAPDAPLIFVNQAFLDTTQYARDEIEGRNCRFLQGPDTDPAAVQHMRQALKAGQSIQLELLNYRKSGEPFWNELHMSPLRDGKGDVVAYLGVQHDVTERRAARDNEQHRQKIEALGRMAGGVGHEINNLLQPLLTLPDLVADDLPADRLEAREDLNCIKAAARDARALVSQILDYTRPGKDTDLAIELGSVLSERLSLIRRALGSGVKLIIDDQLKQPAYIQGVSASDLQQILTNLALNAAHAMDHNGQVVFELSGDDDRVYLSVSDTGKGIAPDLADKIFEPFFTTKPPGEGAGLGLYVVFDLVQIVGGTIELDRTYRDGAKFDLTFPRFKS